MEIVRLKDTAKVVKCHGSVLPNDVLMEIFSRVPLKSLFRYGCASKAWHTMLIENYGQKKMPGAMAGLFYCRNFQSYVRINMCKTPKPEHTINLSFLPCKKPEVVSSCNGMILCTNPGKYGVYACNPATKRWDMIPPLKDKPYNIMALAFDPRRSPHYSVVRVSGTVCMVLSSETREWVQFSQKKFPDFGLDDDDDTRYSFHGSVHVFFNGNLHLLDSNAPTVVGVDLERKVCRKMEVPYTSEKRIARRYIGQFANSLRCAYGTEDLQVYIWDLVDYDSNVWNLKCTINLQDILLKEPWKLIDRINFRSIMAKLGPTGQSFKASMPRLICIAAFHPDLDAVFLFCGVKLFAYHLTSSSIVHVGRLRSEFPLTFWPYSPCFYPEDYDLRRHNAALMAQ